MAQRYVVSFEEEERQELSRLIHTGKGAAQKLSHARILLHADQAACESRWTDEEIAIFLPDRDDWKHSIMSTRGRACATCLCFASRWWAGGTFASRRAARGSIGLRR